VIREKVNIGDASGHSFSSSLSVPPIFTSSYASALTANHSIYRRYNRTSFRYYYEAILISSAVSQNVTIIGTSSMDTFGCIYDTTFEPWNASAHLVAFDDTWTGSGQFRLEDFLDSWSTHILVVSSYSPWDNGSFSVMATSPSSPIVFTLLNIVPSTTTGE
jgi:hypothetical protein